MSEPEEKETRGDPRLELITIEEMAKEIGRRSNAYCLSYLDPDNSVHGNMRQFWSSDNKYILTVGLASSLLNTVTEHYEDGERTDDE